MLTRFVAPLVLVATFAVGCSVDLSSVQTQASDAATVVPGQRGARDTEASQSQVSESELLPAVGPAPGSSHWHAAYMVRICDEVLTPFTSDADPLGIHSHADGLIHIHPFFAESGFEASTLGLFADAMGLEMATGTLTLPGGGTWRDGDLCNGVPGQVFVDRWSGPDPSSPVERIIDDPQAIRFEADGELYQIAFAPADSPPVVPPSWNLISEVSNLVLDPPEPWVAVADDADPAGVAIWTVANVSAPPCTTDQVAESVLFGDPTCFEPGDVRFTRTEAIAASRAVSFNRQPAVELTITPTFRNFIVDEFQPGAPAAETGLVLAVEVDGAVVTAPLLARPSASEDRLILAGGLSTDSALALATVLGG